MCSLSKESNSAGTEGIDWLELKHAVDKEQSLTGKFRLPLQFHFRLQLSLARLHLKVLESKNLRSDLSKNSLFHFKIGTTKKIGMFSQIVIFPPAGKFLIEEGKFALKGLS